MIEKRERRRRDDSTYFVWRARWRDETGAERSKTFEPRRRRARVRGQDPHAQAHRRAGGHRRRQRDARRVRRGVVDGLRRPQPRARDAARLRPALEGHALPRLGQLQLRELSPQVIARFRAELEADGVGIEAIRKTMTMLQGVLHRAVEWGRVPTNAVKTTRKPPKQHRPAVQAIPPSIIELMRARLLEADRLREATLLVVLAYAGLRPQEVLALEWRHVRERTLLIERALSDGQALKNRRRPRTVTLLAPLREDLAVWRRASGSPPPSAPVFPNLDGAFWRASDRRNWRKRIYRPVAEEVGIDGARPYDLRHAFASLLIHEGRLSVVDFAARRRDRRADAPDRGPHYELSPGARRRRERALRAASARPHARGARPLRLVSQRAGTIPVTRTPDGNGTHCRSDLACRAGRRCSPPAGHPGTLSYQAGTVR
jgi:integrase